ncbi:wall-associated receptor kinase-like 8 [Rhododendron vialii]|uniref:wall-associated receptor kinase-like 8 n=1 Tax=Rhododendron vialii TaxID=182163 RepID=UPI00265FC43F|nr:wall-associated receptor kinase-like 8 [Rhododendron vialii]
MVDYQWFSDKDIFNVRDMEYVPAVLDWALNGTCNMSESFCGVNAHCLYDNASSSRSAECFCDKGYEGNPYLLSGCQDIDECSDPNLKRCEGFCLNTPGDYNCSCPDGYLSVDFVNGTKIQNICWPEWFRRNNGNSRTKVIIIASTFSSLGALLLLICMWWLYREVNRRKEAKLKEKFFKRNGGLLLQQQLSSDQGNLETTKLFTSKELEKATDNYNANRILGQGGQGTVYKGMLTDGSIVAIKKSKALNEVNLEPFVNEVVILSKINKRNIVKLFGCCLETEVPMLVYEFIPNGNLSQCLRDQNEEFPLTWDLRLQIATEIAGALYYLHSSASIAIYHRDIKSANILLDEKFRAKVSDFGISRSISVDNTHLTTAVQGTFGYLDPEYFQSSQFTEKSDVYSFGVVLVELLTGKKPILSGKSNEGGSLIAYFLLTMKENRLYDILDARVVKEGGEKEILAVANIAKRCLYLNGSSRRTMKEVVMELDGIRMSNGATATVKQSCGNVEYATEDDLTGPQEAVSTSTGSSYRAMDIELPLLLDKSSGSLSLSVGNHNICCF